MRMRMRKRNQRRLSPVDGSDATGDTKRMRFLLEAANGMIVDRGFLHDVAYARIHQPHLAPLRRSREKKRKWKRDSKEEDLR